MGSRWLYDDSELFLPSAAEHISVGLGLPRTQYISQGRKQCKLPDPLPTPPKQRLHHFQQYEVLISHWLILMICSTSIMLENFGHISGGIDKWTYSTPCNAEIHTIQQKIWSHLWLSHQKYWLWASKGQKHVSFYSLSIIPRLIMDSIIYPFQIWI